MPSRVGSIFKMLEFAAPRKTLAVGIPRIFGLQYCEADTLAAWRLGRFDLSDLNFGM